MPRVPTYDNLQATPTNVPLTRFDAPDMPDFAGRQAQQLGQGMMQAGEAASRIAIDMQNEANVLRRIDARNQAREAMFDLMYHPENGGMNQRGWLALQRDSGKALPDEYVDKFSEVSQKISDGLGNNAQRQMFAQDVAQMRETLYGDLSRHMAQEYKSYHVGVTDATVRSAQQQIALLGGHGDDSVNPETGVGRIDDAVEEIKAAAAQKARLLGLPQTLADVQARKDISNAHQIAIDNALKNGKTSYAALYFKKYKGQMDADDLLRVEGLLGQAVDGQVVAAAVQQTEQRFRPAFEPTGLLRLTNIVERMESAGRRYDAAGNLITSPKGAQGEMQVMPATSKNPGFGVTPARDNSPEELARVGRDYLAAMVKEFGAVDQALAAYNAGPERVKAAIKKAERSAKLAEADPSLKVLTWQDFLPAETRQYVKKGVDAYAAGEGMEHKPTERDYVETAVSLLGSSATPGQVKMAREEATRRFTLNEKVMKQREDENVANVMRMLVSNGGIWLDLPADVRATLPPGKVDDVMNFAKRLAAGQDTTNLGVYNKLATEPGYLANLSDAEFYTLQKYLSNADFKHFSNERAKIRGTLAGQGGPADLNTEFIKQALNSRLQTLRIDPSPTDGSGDAARVGAIRQFVDKYFITAQRSANRRFTDAEITQHLDALFANNQTFKGMFSDSQRPMLSLRVGDLPGDYRDQILDAFKRQGITNPTDAQILDAYWHFKVVRK